MLFVGEGVPTYTDVISVFRNKFSYVHMVRLCFIKVRPTNVSPYMVGQDPLYDSWSKL
jgi:hypothetical protein